MAPTRVNEIRKKMTTNSSFPNTYDSKKCSSKPSTYRKTLWNGNSAKKINTILTNNELPTNIAGASRLIIMFSFMRSSNIWLLYSDHSETEYKINRKAGAHINIIFAVTQIDTVLCMTLFDNLPF